MIRSEKILCEKFGVKNSKQLTETFDPATIIQGMNLGLGFHLSSIIFQLGQLALVALIAIVGVLGAVGIKIATAVKDQLNKMSKVKLAGCSEEEYDKLMALASNMYQNSSFKKLSPEQQQKIQTAAKSIVRACKNGSASDILEALSTVDGDTLDNATYSRGSNYALKVSDALSDDGTNESAIPFGAKILVEATRFVNELE